MVLGGLVVVMVVCDSFHRSHVVISVGLYDIMSKVCCNLVREHFIEY